MIIPPERLAEESEILGRIRRGERVEHIETIRLTKDRRKVNVSVTVSPLLDSEGHVVGASKVARDITERKKTQAELVEARQRLQNHSEELEKTVAARTSQLSEAYQNLETFTYSVAHDLQAPARRMRSLVTILEEELGSAVTAGQREVLQKTMGAADHMIALIKDMMKLAHVGKHVLQYRPTALKELVEQAIAELRPQTQGRQVNWRIGELPIVSCDPGLLRQAVTNLISNAVKYTRTCAVAEIEVGEKTLDDRVAFYVRDNGVGFDMKATGRLFAPFERLHDQSEYEGSGIGLAIAERVIRKHGGRVWADAAPDRGATFNFTLGEGPPDAAVPGQQPEHD